jgi:hypothetical protein
VKTTVIWDSPNCQMRQARQRDFERKRYLPLDLFRPERRRDRVYLHLPIRDVRHGIYRQPGRAVQTESDERQRENEDNQAVAERELQNGFQHRLTPLPVPPSSPAISG